MYDFVHMEGIQSQTDPVEVIISQGSKPWEFH